MNFWELTEEKQKQVIDEYFNGEWKVELDEKSSSIVLVRKLRTGDVE